MSTLCAILQVCVLISAKLPLVFSDIGFRPGKSFEEVIFNTEDFTAVVDFLGLQKIVNRNRIGIIGICGFACMGLNAAAVDKRIKAVALTSMHNMSRVMATGYLMPLPLNNVPKP